MSVIRLLMIALIWIAPPNAIEVVAVKCTSGALVLLTMSNPFELLDSNQVLDSEELDSKTGKELESFIESDRWQRLAIADTVG